MEHTDSSLFRYIFKTNWNSSMLGSTCFYCFVFNTVMKIWWMSKIIKMFLCFKSSKAFLWALLLLATLGLSLYPFHNSDLKKSILAFIFICKLRGLVIEIIINRTNFRTSSELTFNTGHLSLISIWSDYLLHMHATSDR